MALTREQLDERRSYIGGSDVGPILGLDEWRGRWNVWAERVFADQLPFEEEEATPSIASPRELGELWEPVAIKWTMSQLKDFHDLNFGSRAEEQAFAVGENGIAACHLDALITGLVDGKRCGIEAKSTGRVGDWGDPGTGNVPHYVEGQVQHEMYCHDLERIFVPCFLPEFGRMSGRLYWVDRDQEMIDWLMDEEVRFWEYVKSGERPDDWIPDPEVVKRFTRQPKTVADLPAELMDTYLECRARATDAKKTQDAVKATILEMGNHAEKFTFGHHVKEATFLIQKPKTIYGTGLDYKDRCESCKVGSKTSRSRAFNVKERKRE